MSELLILLVLLSTHQSSIEIPQLSFSGEVDGRLNESVWAEAVVIKDFRISYPAPDIGETPSENTRLRVFYDQHNIYFGFECEFSGSASSIAKGRIRDSFSDMDSDDKITIYLDTFRDRRSCYGFRLNPLNTQLDFKVSDGGTAIDPNWDGLWSSATTINTDCWIAEISIPFSILRYGSGDWGVDFARKSSSSDEVSLWSSYGTKDICPERFGILRQLSLKRRDPIVLMPYLMGKAESSFGEDYTFEPNAGLDVKSNVTSNFTLNLTFNPDYAQIEADPLVINLSKSELHLPEKRPFFIEGLELFETPIQLLYTRRMGEILLGGKLVGRIGSYNLSFLNVGMKEWTENYSSVRITRDIFRKSTFGGLFTHTLKNGFHNSAIGVDGSFGLPCQTRAKAQICGSFYPDTAAHAMYGEVNRFTNAFSFRVRLKDITEFFEVESGYIPHTDRVGGSIWSDYAFWPRKYGLLRIAPQFDFYHYANHNGETVLRGFGVRPVRITLQNLIYFAVGYSKSYELYEEEYRNELVDLVFITDERKTLSFGVFYTGGTNYGLNLHYPQVSLCFALPSFSLDIAIGDCEYGNESMWPYNLMSNYQITDSFFFRIFSQGYIKREEWEVNLLVGYEFRPGSVFYLAYNEAGEGLPPQHTSHNRVAALKLGYSLQL